MAAEMTLTPKGYKPRLIEGRLDALMAAFGCVEINGPKWCGKTTTAEQLAASILYMDDPEKKEQNITVP